MNSALLREREQFKKKAAAMPAVEKRKNTTQLDDQSVHKKRKLNKPSSTKHHDFAALAKIVQCLRTKYLEGKQDPVSMKYILKETQQSDIDPNVKSWLFNDALNDNPKVEVVEDKFRFKPIYKLNDAADLTKLLKTHELSGLGGVLWDNVMESLPNAEQILKSFQKRKAMTVITRSSDKKKILFRYEPKETLDIDNSFKKLWNTVAVDALDDKTVTNYLDKEGKSAMKGEGFKKPKLVQKNNKRKNKSRKPKDNEHLADVLQTYDDNTLTQKGS